MKRGAPHGAKSCENRTTRVCFWSGLRNNVIPSVLGFAILLSVSCPTNGQTRPAPHGQLVLIGGMIYVSPTEGPITNGVVVIRNGKIAAVGRWGSVRVPNGVARVDCSGLTVAAGFWNSHVHFSKQKWADAANIPAPELAGQLQAMLTRYGSRACSISGRLGRTRGGSASVSSPARSQVRESARQAKCCSASQYRKRF